MPLIDNQQDGMENVKATGIQFSRTKIENLGSTEYTQATLVNDCSYSVIDFKTEMEACVGQVVESLRLSPRADSLLFRHVLFSDDVWENHGFKLLADINPGDYVNCLTIKANTALYDASENAIDATVQNAADLVNSGFNVNGVIFIITDGLNNRGRSTPAQIRKKLEAACQKDSKNRTLESLITILIGVNVDSSEVIAELNAFKDQAGLTHFIALKDASKKSLAKLAAFISKSISSTSQALGTGGPSKQIAPGQSLTI